MREREPTNLTVPNTLLTNSEKDHVDYILGKGLLFVTAL